MGSRPTKRTRWSAAWALGALAAAPVASGLAAGPPRTVKLAYSRGPGAERCPDQVDIERQVRARLGYEPFDAAAASALSASIRRDGRGLRARIELRGASGKIEGVRDLDSPEGDCVELAAAVAFALSIAIDPLSATRAAASASSAPPASSSAPPPPPPAASSAPPPAASLAAPPPPPASAPTADAAPPAPRPGLHASGGAFVSSGLSPSTGVGLLLAVDARRSWLSLGVEGRLLTPSSLDVSSGKGVSASIAAVALAPCAHAGRFFGCAVGMLGSLQGKGYGVDAGRNDRALFAAAGVRLGVELALAGPVSLRVSGEGLANLTPTTLILNNRAAWSSPTLAGVGGLALAVSFW